MRQVRRNELWAVIGEKIETIGVLIIERADRDTTGVVTEQRAALTSASPARRSDAKSLVKHFNGWLLVRRVCSV